MTMNQASRESATSQHHRIRDSRSCSQSQTGLLNSQPPQSQNPIATSRVGLSTMIRSVKLTSISNIIQPRGEPLTPDNILERR